MSDEVGNMWKKVTMTYIKILLRHLPEGTQENHENLCEGNRCPR
jgi:hypothetical protein